MNITMTSDTLSSDDARIRAERELTAALTEIASLPRDASPSRLERAIERLDAARDAVELAA